MYSLQKLDIRGYRQEPVPHTFYRQDKPTDHAVMVFAGRGINCQHPTLYYPTRELLNRGADTLLVDYCLRPDFSTFSEQEIRSCVGADTMASYQALFQQHTYKQVTLIGKSLGTLVMGHLLSIAPMPPAVQVIWITPLIKQPELQMQIQKTRPHSLFVIGTEDPHYDPSVLAELEKVTEGETLAIQGAEHLLEVPGGVTASLHVMEQVVQAVQVFLDRKP